MNTALTSHTEDLLVKYLDGALSAGEEQEFQSLLTTNPDFAEEVRAVADFDTFLDSSSLTKQWANNVDTAFLADVQRNTAQLLTEAGTRAAGAAVSSTGKSVGAATGSAAGAGAASFLTKSLVVKTVLAAAACGTLGVGAWKYAASRAEAPLSGTATETSIATNPSNEAVSTQASPASPNNEVVQTKPNVAPMQGLGNAAQPKEITSQTSASGDNGSSASDEKASASQQVSQEEQEARANASIDANNSHYKEVEQLVQEFRTFERSGEWVNAAYTAKRLGTLYCRDGQFDESEMYLTKALKTAQNLKLRELEGEVFAEQAILYRATGSTDKAVSVLRDAVKILTEASSTSAAKWTRELERWEKK